MPDAIKTFLIGLLVGAALITLTQRRMDWAPYANTFEPYGGTFFDDQPLNHGDDNGTTQKA